MLIAAKRGHAVEHGEVRLWLARRELGGPSSRPAVLRDEPDWLGSR
jgi:hypothetical protein